MGMMGKGFEMSAKVDNVKATNPAAVIGRLLSYVKPYWIRGILLICAVLLSAIGMATSPYLIGLAVDQFIVPEDRDGLARTMLQLIGVFALTSLGFGGQFFFMAWISQHVLATLREEIFDKLQKLSLSYFDKHNAGDLMSRLVNDVDILNQFLSQGMIQMVGGFFQMMAIIIAMFALEWRLALATLSIVPLMVIITIYLSGRARVAFRKSRETLGDVSTELEEGISGVKVAQAFNRGEDNRKRFSQQNRANRDANVGAVGITSAFAPAMELLNALAIAIVAGYGGILAIGGLLSVGIVVSFVRYVQQFFRPVQQISQFWAIAQAALAGAERIFELLDEPLDLTDQTSAQTMPSVQGKVTFQNVSFSYNPDEPVLRDVDLHVTPGHTVAIVGPTGAGKTTLVNLLGRFYEATNGQVFIDDVNIREVTRSSLRSQMGIVLQDNFLFSGTVADNIRYGRLNATHRAVEKAAMAVGAHEFICQLSQGYMTELGERGGTLSQGQRQLISFARAILADPRILILDEATSSVDTRTELVIQEALKKLLAGRTSFVIAHRLSTIQDADQILVLEEGRIVEQATRTNQTTAHQILLAKDAAYAKLHKRQFRESVPKTVEANGRYHQTEMA
ncbi:MAG: ABC transporter ATP-binding protein [Chloroflexota bacterium]